MSLVAQNAFRVGASLTSTPTRALRALVCVYACTCTREVSRTPGRTQFIISLAACNRGARALVPVAQQKSSASEQFQRRATQPHTSSRHTCKDVGIFICCSTVVVTGP